MRTAVLTKLINRKIENLQSEINGFPTGGGFESLRDILGKLQDKMDGLIDFINNIQGEQNDGNQI